MTNTAVTERATKEFWIINPSTDYPVRATGYECPGQDYWWFPSVGLSIPRSQCYMTSEAAAAASIRHLENRRDTIEDRLQKLRERY